MKKIVAFIFSAVLLFSWSLTTNTYASTNLPIIPIESKSIITIEKSGNNRDTEDPSSVVEVLKTDNLVVNISVGKYVKHVGELNLYLETGNQHRKPIRYDEMKFTSSNNTIFEVSNDYMHGINLGSATLTATYNDQQVAIQVNVIEDDVTIKFENTHNAQYIELYLLLYKDYLGDYSYMAVRSKFNSVTGELKINGIDWSQKGPFSALVALENYIYKIEINQSDRGGVLTVSYNPSEYTNVTFQMASVLRMNTIEVNLLNNNRIIYSLRPYSQYDEYYIANGEYSFSLIGKSDIAVYKGHANKVSLTGTERQIFIPDNQFTKLNFNLDFNEPAMVKNIFYCNFQVSASCASNELDGTEVYLKNDQYDIAYVTVQVGNFNYNFDLGSAIIPSSSNPTIDGRLYSELRFSNQTFKGGSRIYLQNTESPGNYLIIKNANGQKIDYILDNSNKAYNGKLVFRRGNEIYEAPLEDLLSYPSVILPNVSGTFEVIYTMDEVDKTPVKVRPDVSGTWTDWTNTKGSVAKNYTWTITLNDQVNAATVNKNNIFVVDQDGYLVEGVAVTAVGSQISVIAPVTGYDSNKTYTLYVRDAVKNVAGKSLNANTKMQFTTK